MDTLNLFEATTGTPAIPAGVKISNVEVININEGAVGTSVNANAFGSAAQQIWQIGTAVGISGLSNAQTAGFRDVTGSAAPQDLTANFVGTEANIALDGVTQVEFTIADTDTGAADVDLETVNISGETGSILELDTIPGTVETMNFTLSSDTSISVQTAATLSNVVTVDASASTGDLVIGYANVPSSKLETLTLGSGDDQVSVNMSNMTADELTVDLGAGNDGMLLSAADNSSDENALNITLGAGNDTLKIDVLGNISDATEIEADLITVADFNASEDVLDLSDLGSNGRDVLTNTELGNANTAANLAAAAEIAALATTDDDYSIFDFGGDAYILHDIGGSAGFDGGDGLVKVVGFQTDMIDGSNLVA
ncbi:hypothetical protein ACGYLO_20240 [Sulfitobacter sp. 1A13353]|uniref:hypothetical protein n=1 Tax=Sulfitobacter sp. 1A13353 TaxID=3368568 RepID=UPI0037469CC4